MKKFILGIILCAALMIGGCDNGFKPEQLQALTAHVEILQQQVDTAQAAATQMAEEMEAAGIVDPNLVAKIARLNEEADKVQAHIDIIAAALKGVPLTGDAAQDFIAQLLAANVASSAFNPYVVPIGTGLSILSIILGWLAKRNATVAAKEKLKYQAHKQGVERTMKEVSASTNGNVKAVETQLYANIGEARTDLGV